MQQSSSRTHGFSIQDPATHSPELVLIGKKGPAFSDPCNECDDFQTVIIRRGSQLTTVRCTCQLAVAA